MEWTNKLVLRASLCVCTIIILSFCKKCSVSIECSALIEVRKTDKLNNDFLENERNQKKKRATNKPKNYQMNNNKSKETRIKEWKEEKKTKEMYRVKQLKLWKFIILHQLSMKPENDIQSVCITNSQEILISIRKKDAFDFGFRVYVCYDVYDSHYFLSPFFLIFIILYNLLFIQFHLLLLLPSSSLFIFLFFLFCFGCFLTCSQKLIILMILLKKYGKFINKIELKWNFHWHIWFEWDFWLENRHLTQKNPIQFMYIYQYNQHRPCFFSFFFFLLLSIITFVWVRGICVVSHQNSL